MRLKGLMQLLTPRYVVQHGMFSYEDMDRLRNSQPGDVLECYGDSKAITPLPMPTIHLHFHGKKRPPTAAMGPTLRRR